MNGRGGVQDHRPVWRDRIRRGASSSANLSVATRPIRGLTGSVQPFARRPERYTSMTYMTRHDREDVCQGRKAKMIEAVRGVAECRAFERRLGRDAPIIAERRH